MAPPAYGYIRAADQHDDEEIQQLESGPKKLAGAEGLCLLDIHHGYQEGHYGNVIRIDGEIEESAGRCYAGPDVPHQFPNMGSPAVNEHE